MEIEEARQLKAVEIAQRASSMPEVQCSEENIVIENCIDLLKLDAAADIIDSNKIFYFDRLLFSNISINEIYPERRNWTLYESALGNFTSKISTNIPISLFNATNKKYYFGVMKVDTFAR